MENKKEFAGFWIRLIASIVDSIVTMPALFVVAYLFGVTDYSSFTIHQDMQNFSAESVSIADTSTADAISWIILICYSVFFVSSQKQATIGKRICNIYIATRAGEKLSKLQALARFFASIFSVLIFGIGVFMIAFTKEKTALHDLICGTRVFYGKAENK